MEIEINQSYRINNMTGTDLPMSGRIAAVKQCIRWVCEIYKMEPGSFEVDLRNCGEEFGVWAAVNCMDQEAKDFYIMIDPSVDVNDFFLALCHEMVHVWQHCRGDLFEKNDTVFWMNKAVDTANTPYMQLPYEEEAHRLEEDVFNAWVKYWNSQR